jgi:FixJ family two-component response regulator
MIGAATSLVILYGGGLLAGERAATRISFAAGRSDGVRRMTAVSTAPVIHVVDDDALFRNAVARLLRAAGYRVNLYESSEQVLQRLPASDPGCILLDIRMPGLSGFEVQAHMAEVDRTLPIVFVTGHGDIPSSVKAIKAGAEDFLSKPVTKKTLLDAIERALARNRDVRERHDRLNALRNLVATLTPRESEVFALMVRGKLNKQIAYELGAAERTIKWHRHSIMLKLQVRSLAEAVSIAERLGLLATPKGEDRSSE